MAGAATLVLVTVFATVASVSPANAGGFLQDLFGGIQQMFARHPNAPNPLESMAKAPNPPPAQRWGEGGPARGFCVRGCDGFYFPVQANPGVSAAQMCHAFCPASEARIYGGSDIDYAVARDGSRYADTDRAYLYRKQTVPGCTCNGRNQFGLAHIDINSDPTLKPGDVVATRNGMAVFAGRNGVADFTPAATYPGFSPAYRAQLSAMRVRTTPSPDTMTTSSLALPGTAEVSDIRRDPSAR